MKYFGSHAISLALINSSTGGACRNSASILTTMLEEVEGFVKVDGRGGGRGVGENKGENAAHTEADVEGLSRTSQISTAHVKFCRVGEAKIRPVRPEIFSNIDMKSNILFEGIILPKHSAGPGSLLPKPASQRHRPR